MSVCSTGSLTIRILTGSWKVLEVKCEGALAVLLDDAKAFLKDAGIFYLMYLTMDYTGVYPIDLRHLIRRKYSKSLKKVGDSCNISSFTGYGHPVAYP